MVGGRPGGPTRGRDSELAEELVARCDEIEVDGLTFSLAHVWRGEAILRISGGADERVTDSDAFFRAWHPMLRPQPLVPEAERTASACEAWTREVMRRLEGERFNVITLKWFGRPRPVPSFLERHGVGGAFAADSAFLRGPRDRARARAGGGARDGRPGRRPPWPRGAGPRAARRR